jgi:Flp pilus assembly protein TadD
MRTVPAALLFVLALSGVAFAQQQPPAACHQNANGVVDWRACLDATPTDAEWRPLVLINLGTEALMRRDFASAVRYYDEAQPPNGLQLFSDVTFHAYRAVAYWHVGRQEDAQRDAVIAHRMLRRDPSLRMSPQQYIPPGLQEDVIYAFILPVLHTGDPQRFRAALREFIALPAIDWTSYANRAAVMQEIGDLSGAVEMSSRALAMAPDEPGVLNNHCYILYSAGRAAEALPYCERAIAAAPGEAAIRDSMSDVLAALGRCAEAEREIAEARRLDPSSPDYRQPIACAAR